jgi:hypothetical protein
MLVPFYIKIIFRSAIFLFYASPKFNHISVPQDYLIKISENLIQLLVYSHVHNPIAGNQPSATPSYFRLMPANLCNNIGHFPTRIDPF